MRGYMRAAETACKRALPILRTGMGYRDKEPSTPAA
jgi:hypothetical protein